MNITASYFNYLSKRPPRQPRARFVTYYQDLHALYNDIVSPHTFLSGSQYSYAELGDSVLMDCAQAEVFSQLDLLLIATWTQEFDTEYASSSAYFAHKYQFKGKVIDICDQGSLVIFTGFNVIQKYLQANPYKRAMLLFLEQTTAPRNSTSSATLPVYDAACAMLVEQNNVKKPSYEVLSVGVLESNTPEFVADFVGKLSRICQEKTLTVITKKPQLIEINNRYRVRKIPCCPGGIPWLYFLHELIHARESIQYGLILDQDVESNEIGYLILRSGVC